MAIKKKKVSKSVTKRGKVAKTTRVKKATSKKTKTKTNERKRVSGKKRDAAKRISGRPKPSKRTHTKASKKSTTHKKEILRKPKRSKSSVRRKPRLKEIVIPVEHIEHGMPSVEDADRHLTHSHLNAGKFDRVEEVLAKVFLNTISKHTPFEPDEVTIYRHGVSFHLLTPKKKWNDDSEEYITELLKKHVGDGPSIQIIDSGKGSRIVKIFFGSKQQGVLIGDTTEELEKKITLLNDIRSYLSINYGDPYWDTFFETEESFYE